MDGTATKKNDTAPIAQSTNPQLDTGAGFNVVKDDSKQALLGGDADTMTPEYTVVSSPPLYQ
jgi:hypothetical protein